MAIIKEYQHGGAVIRVHNDAYKHLSAQEMEARKQAFLAKAGRLCWEQIEQDEREGRHGEHTPAEAW